MFSASNNLRGTIPIDISILSQLEQISLSGNSLTRNIATTLSYLPNLEVLELDHNNFSGRLDFLFSAARRRQLEAGPLFPRLRTLDLASNVLEGSLPESVGMLSFLQILSLEGNTLTGSVATALSQLSLLNVLSLANNDFDDTLNEILFRRMSQLQYLDLSGNFFRGNLAVLDSLQPLLLLDLSNNMIEGPIPQTLPPNLTTLLLNGNVLTGEIPSSIGLSTKLENMDLSMNELSGEIPLALFRLTTLRSLFLSRNSLVGTLPPYFLNLQFLQELSLRNTNLIGTIPFELPPKLEPLDLSENEMTGEIPTLPTSLRFLLLNRNQFVGSIPTSLSQLTDLSKQCILLVGWNEVCISVVLSFLSRYSFQRLNTQTCYICNRTQRCFLLLFFHLGQWWQQYYFRGMQLLFCVLCIWQQQQQQQQHDECLSGYSKHEWQFGALGLELFQRL